MSAVPRDGGSLAAAASRQPDAIGWPVWRLSFVTVLGAFVAALDTSLVNIGLDRIRADLDAGLDMAQWVATGYLVALAVSLPACGWLGRRIGFGRLWLTALAAFTVASALCAAAPDLGWLIALRVVQGLAAGLLIPTGQTILGRAVGPARLGRVMATLGIVVTAAPVLGPVVGGAILHVLPWQWLFLINLPIGLVAMWLGRRYVPLGTPAQTSRLDWLGFGYVGIGLSLLVYGLAAWGSRGRPELEPVVLPLCLGVIALVAFVRRAGRRPNPLLDLRLYRNPVFAAAAGTAVCGSAVMFGAALLFPLYFQLLRGTTVADTGLLLLALGGGTATALPFAGRLTDRYGGGVVTVSGAALVVVGAVPFAFLDGAADPVLVQALLLLLGGSLAFALVPPGIAAYKTVRAEQLPDATTQVNIGQRIGGALGGALFAVVLARGLSGGAQAAFHTAFWWLAATSGATLVCAFLLRAALASRT